MVTTNQKSTIDIPTKKKKESKHNTKDNHATTREKNERQREGEKDLQKQSQTNWQNDHKDLYISITLTVNGLNAPPKRHRLTKW